MRSQQPLLLAVVVIVVAFQLSSAAVLRDGVEVLCWKWTPVRKYFSQTTYTSPCIRNTPEFNQCIRKSLQLLMGKLSKSGIKELGLESVDPLSIAELEMTYNGGDPVIGADVTLKDTITRGFSAIKVIDVRSKTDDPNFFGMDIDFYVPRIVTNGKYKMEGHVGNYPVNGAGGFNITTTEVTGTWKLRGTPIVEDGETYIRIDRMTVRPEIGGLKAHASNLINDNPELSQIVLAFVNRFWKVLYQEMIPYAEEHFEKILKGIVNKIFLKIPYDQLFPPARLQ